MMMNSIALVAAALAVAVAPAATAQQSTLDPASSLAWAGNLGWIQMRPQPSEGIRVTDTFLAGLAWSDTTGWMNFGRGSPADGVRYQNTDGNDFGVNQDGAGNLTGLAWSANLGWINFSWASDLDPNRPRFDLVTGLFSGYAWSGSVGWITLGTGLLATTRIDIADVDADGISDAWELSRAGNLDTLTAIGDADHDGASDLQEFLADTDPLSALAAFQVVFTSPASGGTRLTWASRPTRLYRATESTDLGKWVPSTTGIMSPDSGSLTTRLIPHPATTSRFFRIEALLPLTQ